MNKLYILVYIFLILLSSCKKERKDTVITKTPFIIEYNNANILVTNINPDIIIDSWNVPKDFLLDINSDGQNDFKFSVMNFYLYGGLILSNSELRIETLNDDSYLLIDSIFPYVVLRGDTVISQSLVDSLYPKVLSLGDTIGTNDDWRNGNFNILKSGQDIPPSNEYFYAGCWWGLDGKHIGIKYKNLLGWIKIGIPYNSSIKIYEFALSK